MALEDYRADMERCSQCSYCKWIPFDHIKSWRYAKGCPGIAYNNFQSFSARGRYAVALSLLEGKSSYSDAVRDVVYKCQTCGSCDVSCKVCRYNLEPLETALEFRAKLVEDGQTLEPHRLLISSLQKEHNLMLKPHEMRSKWVEGISVKDLIQEEASIAFFAGCRFSYDENLQKTARAAVTLLKDAGVNIGILGTAELCCGGRAYQMGYRKEFAECAASNIEALNRAGVKTLITSCADCYHAFKRLYPKIGATEAGLKFEVLHTVEFLDRLIKEGRIKFRHSIPLTVTYHDPCHLGRQGEPHVPWNGKEKKIYNQIVVYDPPKPRYNGAWGIYDPPRDILKSIPGLKLVEMERIREYAWCCGAGGGVKEAYPEFSLWTARERIEEARSTGAEAIISACPWCERNFLDACGSQGLNLKVFDVVDLVKQAI
jgi:Fe-S oxidoreductase